MRSFYWVYGGLALAILIVLIVVARALDPAPPTTVRMATGPEGGAYAAAGAALKARLAADGVTLELVASSGSVENLSLLSAKAGGVDVALLQGGVGPGAPEAEALDALAAVFLEPVWVFHRREIPLADLRGLAGLRVAAGPPGSGARALGERLLAENGLDGSRVTLSALAGAEAAAALRAGEVDVAVFVTAPGRPFVVELLTAPEVSLLSFAHAEAYARRLRFLSPVTLPRGVVDPSRDAPSRDVTLVAAAATLVARESLHPAIQSLLVQAAFDVFREGDLVSAPGRFPNRELAGLALSKEAARYLERGGPGMLRSFLPFWAANLVDRLWVLAIPLLTLMYPLIRTAPPVYRWGVRRRIIRWYRDLRRLEMEGREARSADERARVRAELDRLLTDVGRIEVPLPYNDDLYRLRGHIRLVDGIIADMAAKAGG